MDFLKNPREKASKFLSFLPKTLQNYRQLADLAVRSHLKPASCGGLGYP
jgi:hypothetical protein